MRTLFPFVWLACLVPLLFSCKPHKTVRQEASVVVSILPQKYLVDRISGGKLECGVMIPPGGNHETFEPSPRDMEKVSKAGIYFTIGALDFEKAWVERVKAVNPGLEIVNTGSGITMIEGHSHEGHASCAVDPHIWLSPDAVRIQARSICEALCRYDSSSKTLYERNLDSFLHEADSADRYITSLFEPHQGKSILIYHPALAYFAREYGLNQLSIEHEGKDPSPVHMREIIDLAEARRISVIFVSKEFDTRHAETIAKQINGRLVTFDPMAYNWTTNIMHLADLIAQSMANQKPGDIPAKNLSSKSRP
ncbi:MAG TPA: zinc ABC transporter substrate-binding protein [Bacteroidales bacterium]|nr:zinc ABC transporter substrate-binding protein [Bacteroidales bacterium]HPT00980.1 zinc ABC transporter substrate-binding protein [Bacteroidales bacterium]